MVGVFNFLKEIFVLYKESKLKILKCLVLSILIGVTNIMLPVYLLKIFDDGIGKESVYATLGYGAIFVIITVINVALDYFYQNENVKLERKMVTDLRLSIFNKIEKFEGTFFSNIDNGELYTLLYGDVEKIPRIIIVHSLNLLKNILTLFGLVTFLSALNGRLMVILLLFQLLIIIVQAKFSKIIDKSNEEFREVVIFKNKIAQEIINNYIQIIGANLLKNRYRQVEESENKFNAGCKKILLAMKRNDIYLLLLNSLMIASILCVGGILVINGKMSMGALITFNIFSQRFSTPIVQVYKFPTDILDCKLSWTKIKNSINLVKEMENVKTNYILKGDIELKNVNYAYGEKPILTDLSVKIKHNNSYAIIGESGVGKSTLAKIIYRILEVKEGDIVIDGHKLNGIGIDNIRNQIAYISQEVFIANDTLRANLMVRDDISDDEIVKVLNEVYLKKWFDKLENGLDTNMGDGGLKLSGGERQRIAMARVLLRKANIILLDESTSMLDENTEKQIVDLVSKVFCEKTIIMITHKKAIAKKLDNVIEIKDGNAVFIDKYAI